MALPEQAPSYVPHPHWLQRSHHTDKEFSWTFLVAMTLVGAALRLLELTGQSLWVDELLTWNAIRPGSDLGFYEQVFDTIQGPLYLSAVWPLLQMQDSALMLRLPAVAAGILAVPLFGWLAFRALGGRAARLALLLFALSPFHIWYSQEGRGYAFLMLFSIVTALIYLAMVRRGPSVGWTAAFAASGAALVLSNLSGVFLLAAMALTVVTVHRPARRSGWGWWLLAFTLAGVLVTPWLLKATGIWAVDRIVPGAGTGVALRGETTFSLLAVPYAVFTFFFGYSLGPSLRELHQPDRMAVLADYWPLLTAGAAAVGAALLGGLLKPDRRRLALVVWIAVPVGLLMVLALRNIKPWNPRYVSVVLPWLVLLAGAGLARLPRRPGLAVAVVLAGLTLWSLGGYFGADRYGKADLRQAVAEVGKAQPPSRIVLVPTVTSVFRYYDRDAHLLLDSYRYAPLHNRADAATFVAETLGGHDFCRVVLAREWYFDPEGHLLPALSRVGHLRLEKLLPGVSIYTWQRKESPAVGQGSGWKHGS